MNRLIKLSTFVLLVCACVVGIASAAVNPAREITKESLDILRSARKEARLMLTTSSVTASDVGDADSFGRNVKYLGLAQTSLISMLPDCTPDPSAPPLPNDRCIALVAQPGTNTVNETELGSMSLPARATKSLLCFALTPIFTYQYNNLTGVAQSSARFSMLATISITNEVLDDPSLIDPNTGLPFNGKLDLALTTYSDSRSLAVNERIQTGFRFSRNCIGGVVNKQSLVDSYGLTEAQANQFFQKPMTLSFGASGSVRLVDFASYMYGIRFYGD